MLDDARAQVAAIQCGQAQQPDAAVAGMGLDVQQISERNNVALLQTHGVQGMNQFNLGPLSPNQQRENNGYVANSSYTFNLNNAGEQIVPAINLMNFMNMQSGSMGGGPSASSSVGNDCFNNQYTKSVLQFAMQQQYHQQQQPSQVQVVGKENFTNSVHYPLSSTVQIPLGMPSAGILHSQVLGGNNMINQFLQFGVLGD